MALKPMSWIVLIVLTAACSRPAADRSAAEPEGTLEALSATRWTAKKA